MFFVDLCLPCNKTSLSVAVQTLHVDLDMLILKFGEISETSMVRKSNALHDLFYINSHEGQLL